MIQVGRCEHSSPMSSHVWSLLKPLDALDLFKDLRLICHDQTALLVLPPGFFGFSIRWVCGKPQSVKSVRNFPSVSVIVSEA